MFLLDPNFFDTPKMLLKLIIFYFYYFIFFAKESFKWFSIISGTQTKKKYCTYLTLLWLCCSSELDATMHAHHVSKFWFLH